MVRRRIEWSDTDASGRWHNTAGFRLIEVAETALLERLGILDDVYGRLPRVHVDAHFSSRLEFHDVVDAVIEVTAVGKSSVSYRFELRRGLEVAMRATVVAVLLDPDGRPAPWPQRYRDLLLRSGSQASEQLGRLKGGGFQG
jgi:acyl-CoA thioester hydrolase